MYKKMMDNEEVKSYFLSCKYQPKVFINIVIKEIENDQKHSGILHVMCMDNHSFKNVLVYIVAKFFNVMAKNFASEINSKAHVAKKRSSEINPKAHVAKKRSSEKNKPSSSSTKIRKLQSQN